MTHPSSKLEQIISLAIKLMLIQFITLRGFTATALPGLV